MKRILALLLCLAMVATVFAACGGGGRCSPSSTPTPQNANATPP